MNTNNKCKYILFTLIMMLGFIMLSKTCFAKNQLSVTLKTNTYYYTGNQIKPAISSVAFNDTPITDYSIIYGPNKAVGNQSGYVMVSKNINGTIYKATAYFSIKPKQVKSENLIVTLDKTEFTYDGKEHKPSVISVKFNNITLKSGTDYFVEYFDTSMQKNLTDVGKKKCHIILTGNYTGDKIIEYNITPRKDINVSLDKDTFVYDGLVHKPNVIVTNSKGQKLKKDNDYTLTYLYDSINVGDYSVFVKVRGKYFGDFYLKYTIKPKPLSKSDFEVNTTFNYLIEGHYKTIDNILNNFIKKSKLDKSMYDIKFVDENGKDQNLYTSAKHPITENVNKLVITCKDKNYTGRLVYNIKINKIDISKFKTSSPELILYEDEPMVYFKNRFSLKSDVPIMFINDKEIFEKGRQVYMYDKNYDSKTKTYKYESVGQLCTLTYIYNVKNSTCQIICTGTGNLKNSKTITMKVIDVNKNYKKGDANGDGKVDSLDARLVQRMSVKLETKVPAADMDLDGKVTTADARLVLRKSVGLK